MSEPVSHEAILFEIRALSLDLSALKEAAAENKDELAAHRHEFALFQEQVRPLTDNIPTLEGITEVAKAAGLWRKFMVSLLGFILMASAVAGVATGAVYGVKRWILEG
jgi:hypothetical protein